MRKFEIIFVALIICLCIGTMVHAGVNYPIYPISGTNWTGANIPNNGINWTDNQLVQSTRAGLNWQSLDPATNGINWTSLSNGSALANIVCWKANGMPGKCTTGVSGALCTSCT